MDFAHIGKRSGPGDDPSAAAQLKFLLQSAQAWRQLDQAVKQHLPANLHPHIRTACIDPDGSLVLLAANSTAAARLKMLAPALLPQLQAYGGLIRAVRVKTVPKTAAPPKQNTLKLSPAALEALADGADRLQHHPGLAATLRRLVGKYQK
ncbi:DciA family protein [Neisseria bacilliformis]|uniref:DciA family protein n=1 Tax=Neisseria bacilliformis TaxID=267212 RepID=UPI0028EE67D0|nr:DciA family protein [Neisseria bacilliformis]